MPDPALLTPLGREMLADLPSFLRDDPDVQAVIHCQAREAERIREYTERVRAQFFPQTADELGLPFWEALLRLTVAPVGLTAQERRDRVLAMLKRLKTTVTGVVWQDMVTAIVGPGWSYEENVPGDPSSPPPNTLRIVLPFPPSSDLYQLTESVLREVTPWHVDIVLTSAEGFILDVSQMDQEPFHPE